MRPDIVYTNNTSLSIHIITGLVLVVCPALLVITHVVKQSLYVYNKQVTKKKYIYILNKNSKQLLIIVLDLFLNFCGKFYTFANFAASKISSCIHFPRLAAAIRLVSQRLVMVESISTTSKKQASLFGIS